MAAEPPPTSISTSSQPWVEKYRPQTMEDVVFQDEVILTLKKAIETGSLPHLLFYGTPGTGKTSTILAVARELYGSELMKERVLELNASDERGIAVVRAKVKNFAMATAVEKTTLSGKRVPAYKLIILDEADSMTSDAQNALRRTMEIYSRTTRFCLICNYISRIIEPLASRCAKFRFKPLTTDTTISRLEFICHKEGCPYGTEVLLTICQVSNGDLRKAINYLQSLHTACPKGVTPATVKELAGWVPDKVLSEFLKACNTNSVEELKRVVNQIRAAGYAADQFINQLMDVVYRNTALNELQKAKIAEKLSEADHALQDGSDETLQLLAVGAHILSQGLAQENMAAK